MSKQYVCVNGRFLPIDRATVSVMDRGFQYGDAVFETIRADRGIPHALAAHVRRMKNGARVLGIRFPYTTPEIQTAVTRLLKKNRTPDALVKIMITRGPAKEIGLSPRLAMGKPTFCIFTWPIDPHFRRKESYQIVITKTPRNTTPITGLKSANYLSHVLAKAEADRAGADEAVFVDSDGNVLEGTISNIFIVRHGTLITPPLSLGILDGITRKEIMQAARRLKILLLERAFKIKELRRADEAFLSFTSAGIMPIRKVNDKKIGFYCPGKITLRLQAALS